MLKEFQIAGTIYFIIYIGMFLMNKIIFLELNPLLTSLLSFIECLLKFPNDIIDLIITYFELDHYLVSISFVLFLKSIYDLTLGEGLEF